MIEKPGRPAIEVIAEIVPEVVTTLPVAEIDALGRASAKPGALGWVRPLHSIVATFGPETEEPEIVRFAVDGIAAGDDDPRPSLPGAAAVQGAPARRLRAKLEGAKVVLDPERRKEIILADAKNLAFAQGYELVEDAGLLAEVAGLVEWPVVLMGSFDEAFLDIPPEVIRTTIRNNQKCFVLRDPATAQLANKFILVANIEAADGGEAIVAGNERVIRARLSDAKFFYETDLEDPAGRPPGEVQGHRVPREARHAMGAHRAHRAACAPSLRRSSAPTSRRRSARRGSPRPTCSPKWSANFPSCRG